MNPLYSHKHQQKLPLVHDPVFITKGVINGNCFQTSLFSLFVERLAVPNSSFQICKKFFIYRDKTVEYHADVDSLMRAEAETFL